MVSALELLSLLRQLLLFIMARMHHHIMKEASVHRQTRVQNILLLLIESGALFCTLQALDAVSTLIIIYGPTNLYLFCVILSGAFVVASVSPHFFPFSSY